MEKNGCNRPRGVVVSAPSYEPWGPGFDSRLVAWVLFPIPTVTRSLQHEGNRLRGVVVSGPGYDPRSLGFDSRLVPWQRYSLFRRSSLNATLPDAHRLVEKTRLVRANTFDWLSRAEHLRQSGQTRDELTLSGAARADEAEIFTLVRDSNTNISVISSPVYCESDALYHTVRRNPKINFQLRCIFLTRSTENGRVINRSIAIDCLQALASCTHRTKDVSIMYCLPIFGLKERVRGAPTYSVTIRTALHLATDATGKCKYQVDQVSEG
uniref:Uncharacterized protein n=1 Tax=Timema bartmani TaxID=61472 RepID=A0A7R9EPE6_9NEOP|nr:unnamed protein product [Timema bartmani]